MDIENLSNLSNRELLDEIEGRGFFVSKVPPTVSGKTFSVDVKKMAGNKYRFGVISCTHIGLILRVN